MADSGEHHRHVVLVGRRDDLGVAERAARVDHRRDAGLRDDVEAVAEREKRIGRAHGAGPPRPPSRARMTARRAASTRVIWPPPTPTTWARLPHPNPFHLTWLATPHANPSA